jgi:dTDP-4-dehydrorhamnose 3,5-epimerase
MKFIATDIPGVIVIEPQIFRDERGFFLETYHQRKYQEGGIDAVFVQDNHSRSQRGSIRGLHAQVGRPQGKLIHVVEGEVYDVAVDLRRSSPTFGRWVSGTLSCSNNQQLWIPPGFAHGFYVLSESADLLYKCTDYYAPSYDRALKWDDPELGIPWPLISGLPPLLSTKDAAAPLLRDAPSYP